MKYLKAFENAQIKWYNKGLFDSPIEIDNVSVEKDLLLAIYKKSGKYYLIEKDSIDHYNNVCVLFEGMPMPLNNFIYDNIFFDENIEIHIEYEFPLYANVKFIKTVGNWKNIKYKDMPDNIKNRIEIRNDI